MQPSSGPRSRCEQRPLHSRADPAAPASSLVAILRELGQHEPSRQLAEDTLAPMRRVLGDDHPDTLRSASSLTADLRTLGEHQRVHELEEWIKSQTAMT
jgi:hypothetical protein